nr:tRNA (adenine N(1)) methyltransferase [Hymenolepis microstoma]
MQAVWKPIEENDKVIVQRGDNFQIVTIKSSKNLDVGKDKVPMSQLIGYPMGSTLLFDGTAVTQVKEEEINVNSEIYELESSRDNRNLFDRSDNQTLTAEDIQCLKSTGFKGNAIISKLVEKSTTFHMKTKYSQEKYLNKKKKNYLCVFTIRPHTARNLCDMHMVCKATTLRYDSLVQLLTFANVHAGSTVLLTESYTGLVSKAVLERLGHRNCGSRLINFHHGTSTPVIDVSPLGDYSPIYYVQFEDVTSLLLTGKFAREHREEIPSDSPQHKKPRTEDTGVETATAEDKLTESEEPPQKTEDDVGNQEKKPLGQRKKRQNERYCAMTPEIRQKRQQEKQKQWNEICRILCPTESQLSSGLEDRPDCLIVATKFYPVEITLLLMQFLPPGRPFVVHSHILSTLVDLYNILKRRGSCTQLQLHDTWLRPIQVLPNRTHPVMKMTSGGGGFILRGYTVQRLEDPDAHLTRSTMRASTKQLFDEGLISYSK